MTQATSREEIILKARQSTLVGIAVNSVLATVKALAGIFGNSYALIADAIESGSDVVSSIVVWSGLKIAATPASESHPYGKGRAETIAAIIVALTLVCAAFLIAKEGINEIRTPHHSPAAWTLVVLVLVIVVKESLFRFVFRVGESSASTAVKTDAWHHRSDAITSAAAFIGISISIFAGKGWESADDWAALFASAIIGYNAWNLLVPAMRELVDVSPDKSLEEQIRLLAADVDGVEDTHRCWVRKLGFDYFVELDIVVDGELSVQEGHSIAHNVQTAVRDSIPTIGRVMIHVEPNTEYGRYALPWEVNRLGQK